MNKILISALLLTAGYAFGQMEIGWDSSNLKKKVKSIRVKSRMSSAINVLVTKY